MTERLGRFRYRTYEFPKLNVIKRWSAELMRVPIEKLNKWESEFIKDTALDLLGGIELSEEQVYKIEQLYAKYTN